MAALDVVNKLRQKNRDANSSLSGGKFPPDYPWGTLAVLSGREVSHMARQELRNHLEARDLSAVGNKRQLVERLAKSVLEEMTRLHADKEQADFELQADLEERGCVYGVGTNSGGQLGVGDLEHRSYFTAVQATRGLGVNYVATGYDMTFAVTDDHDVLVWGGRGVGPMGLEMDPEDSDEADLYLEPRPVRDLAGEEVVRIAVGSSHAAAISQGGDVYCWGHNNAGQLGQSTYATHHTPVLVQGLHEGAAVCQISTGENHTLALTTSGAIYSWGHGQDGRLGVGTSWRVGVPEKEKHYFPSPMEITTFSKEPVRQLACGHSFALALTASGLWSWGCGDGGVLGHGDTKSRESPGYVEGLNGSYIMQVAAGKWHAAAIVLVPPLVGAGYVYTWGSGYHGQLGQGATQVTMKPTLMVALLKTQQFVKYISCGSHHNAAITADGELYTWGSNKNGCLGRTLVDCAPYTAAPGHVGGFGALVGGIGRGLPRSVSCGKEFTIVATSPYEGPTMAVAQKISAELAAEEEEMYLNEEAEQTLGTRAAAGITSKANDGALIPTGTAGDNLCSICEDCAGFIEDPFKSGVCRLCQHSSNFHTRHSQSAMGVAGMTANLALSKQ